MAEVHVEHEPFIPIKIDRTDYKIPVDQNPVNGAYLRQLGSVGSDYDLWLKATGSEDDTIIEPSTVIDLKPGMHFYTAKSVIAHGGRPC